MYAFMTGNRLTPLHHEELGEENSSVDVRVSAVYQVLTDDSMSSTIKSFKEGAYHSLSESRVKTRHWSIRALSIERVTVK